jgi:hypothetical protein
MKPRARSVYFSMFISFASLGLPSPPLRHDYGIFIGVSADRIDISQSVAGRRPVCRLDANVGIAAQNGRGPVTNSRAVAWAAGIP